MTSLATLSFLIISMVMSFFQFSLTQLLCHEFERLALEQFKNSFLIMKNVSLDPLAYSKVGLWKSQGSDCCSWEGITCDNHTGRVIGLDLESSCLFGSINSSSSLFRLVHLQYLNLADNHFNYSEMPSEFGNLSRLSYLSLSGTWISGQVPYEISKLSKLTELDLSWNVDDVSNQGLLQLKTPHWKSLVQNLTRLEFLLLSSVNINSSVPHALANLSSLAYLGLKQCGLFGEVPNAIFQLPKLEKLYLANNRALTGNLPEFRSSNLLKSLSIADISFSGELPKSLGLLSSLEFLDASNCKFSGILASSVPTNLTTPNYDSLSYLGLANNHFTGPFPSWLTNLTQLALLSLAGNMIQGTLPSSISRLKNLQVFDVGSNKLTGTVEMETFLGLQHLTDLYLSDNAISLLTKNTSTSTNTTTTPKFSKLFLVSCNLKEFPTFLQNQEQLQVLILANNKIHGQIPKWLLKLSPNMLALDLSGNSLTSFEESHNIFSSGLVSLDLRSNFIKGSLPIPPPSIIFFMAANNLFDGEIPLEFCNMTSLQVLHLSGNNLSGMIPQCLDNGQTKTLSYLNLGQNNLQGKLPRSLANCKNLEYLDLSNNQIRDTFPSWLGVLPHLKIVILRSNGFYGVINGSDSESLFPELRIVDFSQNEFIGPLPFKYFQRWNIMANLDEEKTTYLDASFFTGSSSNHKNRLTIDVPYTMTVTNKGRRMEYSKVLEIFTAMDFSCNKFSGEIPEIVGNLKRLQLLNISNNILYGSVPSVLGYLSNLEALDLSNNKLSGRIPTELTQLTFLAVFNVSNNLLTGPIPRGSQFDTFENSSFEGNSGLCGMPLSKKCGNHVPLLPSSSEGNGKISLLSEIGWRAVLIGCGCGFLGGAVLGVKVFASKQEWLMNTFRIKQGRRRSAKR